MEKKTKITDKDFLRYLAWKTKQRTNLLHRKRLLFLKQKDQLLN